MATWYDLRDPYAALGVRKVINVATTLTAIGGSTIPEEVLRAMNAAANWHVDMRELHEKAGDALAEMTRNEAAYVTTGCAAAISLAVLACATGGSPERIARVPFGLERSPNVLMHRAHRMPYDRAIELVGARIRDSGAESGSSNSTRTERAPASVRSSRSPLRRTWSASHREVSRAGGLERDRGLVRRATHTRRVAQ